LDKVKWVNGSKSIAAYRDQLIAEQGGVCAILGEPMEKPCLDHDHIEGKCRGVIGSEINMFEGQVQKLWGKHVEGKTQLTMTEVLRRLADYLEEDKKHFKFHAGVIAEVKSALKRRTKETIARNALFHLNLVIDQDLDKGDMIAIYLREFVKQLEESYSSEFD